MVIRVRFAAEVYINADNVKDAKNKWEDIPLFSADALEEYSAEFVELEAVEDGETYKDLEEEWHKS